jgi:hypothetical protein
MSVLRDARATIAVSALATCVLLLGACDKDDSATTPPPDNTPAVAGESGGRGDVSKPCDLTEPSVVAEVFGGTVDGGEKPFSNFCSYELQATTVEAVSVTRYGDRSSWSGLRDLFKEQRGPLADVSGVGDDAFNPGDVGDREVLVLAGNVVFSVGVMGDTTRTAGPKVTELARRIADSLR